MIPDPAEPEPSLSGESHFATLPGIARAGGRTGAGDLGADEMVDNFARSTYRMARGRKCRNNRGKGDGGPFPGE